MKVLLNETEIAFCYQVASIRRMINRGLGVKDETLKSDFMDSEILGVLGEYAFAKAINVFPRLIDRVKGGGEDCVFQNYQVDVKATRDANKGIFVHKVNLDIEIFFLAVVNLPSVEIKGWQSFDVVINEKNKNADGQYYYKGKLNQHELAWKGQ